MTENFLKCWLSSGIREIWIYAALRFHSYWSQNADDKSKENNWQTVNGRVDVGKGRSLFTVSGSINWHRPTEISIEFSQKSRNRSTVWFSYINPGHTPKGL